MKKFSLALAAFLGLTILAPTTAEAGHRSRVCVDHYGYTVHSEYRFAGHDRHGCRVYRWVVVRRVPPCDRGYAGYHGGGHHRGGHRGFARAGHRGGHSHRSGGISLHWSR